MLFRSDCSAGADVAGSGTVPDTGSFSMDKVEAPDNLVSLRDSRPLGQIISWACEFHLPCAAVLANQEAMMVDGAAFERMLCYCGMAIACPTR